MDRLELERDLKDATECLRVFRGNVDLLEKEVLTEQGKLKQLETELAKCRKTELDLIAKQQEIKIQMQRLEIVEQELNKRLTTLTAPLPEKDPDQLLQTLFSKYGNATYVLFFGYCQV
jgi:chromosome segregation ATPase